MATMRAANCYLRALAVDGDGYLSVTIKRRWSPENLEVLFRFQQNAVTAAMEVLLIALS
ncbi:MAG: hypothetical protein ACJ0DF_09700 [Paracoccaceae bacterium]